MKWNEINSEFSTLILKLRDHRTENSLFKKHVSLINQIKRLDRLIKSVHKNDRQLKKLLLSFKEKLHIECSFLMLCLILLRNENKMDGKNPLHEKINDSLSTEKIDELKNVLQEVKNNTIYLIYIGVNEVGMCPASLFKRRNKDNLLRGITEVIGINAEKLKESFSFRIHQLKESNEDITINEITESLLMFL